MQVKRQQYRYFFCLGRHLKRTECDQPYMPADELEKLVEAQYFRVFIPDDRKQAIRRFVAEEVDRRFGNLVPSKEAAKRRIAQLETERQRLLRLYLAGSLEIADFQREQDRIASETETLSARAEPEAELELAPKVVERAFAIIDDIAQAYLRGDEREREMWNEAVFAGIWVGDRGIKRTEYRDLFASILSDTSSNWVSVDLGTRKGCEQVEVVIAAGLDILVANAGFSTRGSFPRLPLETEVAEVELNVVSTLGLCHATAAMMSRRGHGRMLVTRRVASGSATDRAGAAMEGGGRAGSADAACPGSAGCHGRRALHVELS